MNNDASLPPPIGLFLAHAPRTTRDQWRWLWLLDQRLVRLGSEASEPMLAQIRLAWWRDQINGRGKTTERRDPMLIALDAFDAASREKLLLTSEHLVDAVEALTVNDGGLPLDAARDRGEALARLPAELLGKGEQDAAAIGRYWGLAQLAPLAAPHDHAEHGTWADQVRAAAAETDAKAPGRAVSLIRLHARMLIESQGAPLGPKTGLRLITHALTGL